MTLVIMSRIAIRFITFALTQISVYAVAVRRVVGGEYAVINEFPHLGLLTGKCNKNEQWTCGASILNQRILLTAAHCFQDCDLKPRRQNRIMVFFGSTYTSDMQIQRRVSQIATHARWDEITGKNDIALAFVRRDIPFGRRVKRVIISRQFPTVTRLFEAFVAGWGDDQEPLNYALTDHLRKSYEKIRSSESCSRYGKMYEGMFCAGKMQKDGDFPSIGDSGSALVTRKRYYQIGIVSFGWVLYPAMTVYTNVSYYHGWITHNARQLFCDMFVLMRAYNRMAPLAENDCNFTFRNL